MDLDPGRVGRAVRQERGAAAPDSLELRTAGCGTLDQLNDRIAQRSNQVQLARLPVHVTKVRAEIRKSGGLRRDILLTVTNRAGQRFVRRMQAQGCDEALDALALLIVLTLDPTSATSSPGAASETAGGGAFGGAQGATTRPAAITENATQATGRAAAAIGSSAPSARTPDAPATGTFANRAGTDHALRQPEGEKARVRPVESSSSSATGSGARDAAGSDRMGPLATASRVREAAPLKERSLLMGGVGAIALVGPAPSAMVGGAAYAVWGWNRASLWSPSISVRAAHLERNGVVAVGGIASFTLDALQVEVCPLWLGLERRVSARACASGSTGYLTARGSHTIESEVHRSPFTSFGSSAALTFVPVWRVEIEATAGFGFPLQRYVFQFQPGVFHQVAAVSLVGGLGVGLRFL